MKKYIPRLPKSFGHALRPRLTLFILASALTLTFTLDASARQCQPPPAPTLTATGGKALIRLSWTNSGTNVGYGLYKSSTGEPGSYSFKPRGPVDDDPLAQIDGVPNNTTYYYFVRAYNSCGESYSNVAAGMAVLGPTSVTASPGKASINVSWSTVTNADSYMLYKSSDGQNFAFVNNPNGSGSTSYTDYGVTNGVNYYYYVLTYNSGGAGQYSNVAAANVNLAAPLGVKAERLSNGQVQITWNPVQDADNYAVYRSLTPDSGFFFEHDSDDSSSNTSALDTNVAAGAVYYYYVIASNTAGYSPPSAVASTADAGMRPEACYCPVPQPAAGSSSEPQLTAGSGQYNGGGSDHDPVNLATGAEGYTPDPDISVYNPGGLGVVWQRLYHSYQALRGYGSPGFSAGWTHPYDITLQGPSSTGTWGALNLVYANGASETLTPQLDAGGQPTGVLLTRAGAPYLASGVPGVNAGEWTSVTLTWKDQTAWRFTPFSAGMHTLGRVTNRVGGGLDLTWNGDRTLAQVADTASGTTLLTLSYGANGTIASVADAYGRQVSYAYSAPIGTAPGKLVSVSQVGAVGTTPPARWTFTYDSAYGQQLHTISTPSPTGSGTSTATISYDTRGRVTSLVDANGNQRVITYGAGSTQVQVKNAAGTTVMSWTQNYSATGRDTGVTDASSHSSLMEYGDTANPLMPTRVVDRNGKETTFTYDQFGNVLTATTPRSVTTTYTYDYTAFALGRLVSVKEGTKPATTFAYYEPSGLLQSVTSPSPTGTGTVTTSYTYDVLGNVLTVTGPGNNAASQSTTTYNYTADGTYTQAAKLGQPLTITDNLGHATHLRYDAQGRATSLTDARGNETDFAYNLAGQLTETTYPATGQTGTGHTRAVSSYLYTGGPLTAATLFDESNVQARQVTFGYGPEGEALSVAGSTEPVTYTYDALYRLKTLKDGKNNQTTYSYNSVGLLSQVQMPGGESVQFTSYDNAGHLLQRVDGNNVTTNYLYSDSENRLTDIQYPATPTLNVHFGYDSFGRRNSMTDSSGSHGYVYGDLDELKSVTTTYAGLPAQTIGYTYYADGSRQTMTTPAGTFNYGYDAAGRASSLTNPSGETTGWVYYDDNRLNTQTLANGAQTVYTFNPAGQLSDLLNKTAGGTTLSDYGQIAYDGAGNRTSVTASVPGASALSGTTGYQYDTKDQLTQEQTTRGGGFTDGFGYDGAGNPTTFRGATKAYDSNNQQADAGFTYDSNGNPTSYNGVALTFDPENRLTSYGGALTAGYRGDGLRAWKENTGGRTYFLYDGAMPIVELDSSGTVTATNTFGAQGLVSRHTTSSTFYTFDPRGGVTQRQDSAGAVLSSHLFRAHGTELTSPGVDPFGYGAQWGYYTDSETGLQLLTRRYYDPQSGRFLTRDPIGYRGGVNLYTYVRNNAIRWQDPSGQDIGGISVGGGAFAGFGDMGPSVGGSGGTLYGYNTADGTIGTASSYGSFYPEKKCDRPGFAIGSGAGLGLSAVWSNANDWNDLSDGFDTYVFYMGPVSVEVDYGANNIKVVQVSPGASFGDGLGYAHYDTYTPPDTIGTLQGLGSNIAKEIDKLNGGYYCGCR